MCIDKFRVQLAQSFLCGYSKRSSSLGNIRQLAIKWNDVLSRIRVLPDFSRFLLPPLFLGYVIVIPLAYTTSQRLRFSLPL